MTEKEIQKLINQGYRRVSNVGRKVARIDKPDWIDILYSKNFGHNKLKIIAALKDFYDHGECEGFRKKTVEYEAQIAANHFRRCYSEDNITIRSEYEYSQFPGSNWDLTGYIEKKE